jgi:hypothetical protein
MRSLPALLLLAACHGGPPPADTSVELVLNTAVPMGVRVRYDGMTVVDAGQAISRSYATLAQAEAVNGTVETLNGDGSVRATISYQFGASCTQGGHEPAGQLARETLSFAESSVTGAPAIGLVSVECVERDGTGVLFHPG